MKVDMSPKAVTEWLKTMNELWTLSAKLMNSKKLHSPKVSVGQGNTTKTFANSESRRS